MKYLKSFENINHDLYEKIDGNSYREYIHSVLITFNKTLKIPHKYMSELKKISDNTLRPALFKGAKKINYEILLNCNAFNTNEIDIEIIIEEIDGSRIKYDLIISYCEDEWFYISLEEKVWYIKSKMWITSDDTIYFRCDQFDGLLQFLKDKYEEIL